MREREKGEARGGGGCCGGGGKKENWSRLRSMTIGPSQWVYNSGSITMGLQQRVYNSGSKNNRSTIHTVEKSSLQASQVHLFTCYRTTYNFHKSNPVHICPVVTLSGRKDLQTQCPPCPHRMAPQPHPPIRYKTLHVHAHPYVCCLLVSIP